MWINNLADTDNVSLGKNVMRVLSISGLFGFCLGIFVFPTWQYAIEPAQIITGMVKYTPDNTFYIFNLKSWTIINQITAVLLKLGLSERLISFLFSGIIGMIAYQALALIVLSISLSPLLSIIAPFFIHVTGLYMGGVTYAIALMGYPHTQMVALPYILMVAALIALKQYKLGGLLLGMSIAVHPSLGLWFTITVLLYFILDLGLLRDMFRQAARFIIAGYSITFISFVIYLVYLHSAHISINVDQNIASKYLSAFISFWDGHRRTFSLSLLKPVALTMFICILWSTFWKRDLPRNATFLLRCCIISILLAAIFSVTYWLPLDKVPPILLAMMPSRLFNFALLAFVPLLLGLLWIYRNNFIAQFIFLTLIIASYRGWLFYSSMLVLAVILLWMLISRNEKKGTLVGLAFWVSSAAIALILRIKPMVFASYLAGIALLAIVAFLKINPKSILQKQEVPGFLRKAALAILCLSILAVGKMAIFENKDYRYSLYDHSDDLLFAEVGKRQGLLLTGSRIQMTQVRTRRPILLWAANLDILAYLPELGPEINQILREVYGVDIFHPPQEVKFAGGLMEQTGKNFWETRTMESWSQIRNKFGVTDVLTYADWKLQLPEVIHSSSYVLYNIPKLKTNR
ncbi:MAG: hypothetical protein HZA27_01780 [Candidatus Omnitrophica bacterium]|nr:hypothetical protein [Candidatus Omnitrophota bacterium]